MPRTPAIALAFLLALAPALAGCVGTAAASAATARSAADEAARAWDPAAQLVNVLGVEGTFPLAAFILYAPGRNVDEADFESASEDERVGDGLAAAWLYRYAAAGKDRSFVVVVDAEDTVLRAEESDLDKDDAPLSAWSLDSDAALERALAASEDLRRGVEAERFGVVALLREDPERARATWLVIGGGASGFALAGGLVVLDAVTGEVLVSEGVSSGE